MVSPALEQVAPSTRAGRSSWSRSTSTRRRRLSRAVHGPGRADAAGDARRAGGRPAGRRRAGDRRCGSWVDEALAGSESVSRDDGAARPRRRTSTGAYPRLSDDADRRARRPRASGGPPSAGDVLVAEGQRDRDFLVVLAGKVAVIEGIRHADERTDPASTARAGSSASSACSPASRRSSRRRAGAGRGARRAACTALRELVARTRPRGPDPAGYLSAPRLLIGVGAGFRIVGSRFAPDTRRLREFAARNRLPHRGSTWRRTRGAEELLRQLRSQPEETPVVIWRGPGAAQPDNAELARVIGLPALGHAAGGVRPRRRRRGPGRAGRRRVRRVGGPRDGRPRRGRHRRPGGTSSRIENYLGFPAGISGAELADRAVMQARKFGARLSVPAEAVALGWHDGYHDRPARRRHAP